MNEKKVALPFAEVKIIEQRALFDFHQFVPQILSILNILQRDCMPRIIRNSILSDFLQPISVKLEFLSA